jgi:hypothetical protein
MALGVELNMDIETSRDTTEYMRNNDEYMRISEAMEEGRSQDLGHLI